MNNLSLFLEAIPTPIFWVDHNKVYQGCNQIFSDLMGFDSPAEIVGLTDDDLPYSATDLKLREEVFDAILTDKEQAKILYDCIIGFQDKMIWVQKRFTPLKNCKGKTIGVLGVIVDISEKVERRKERETHLERIHALGSFLDELNIKSPLSTNYKELVDKSIVTLQRESQASLAMLIKANAPSPQNFFQFVIDSVDVSKFFENRDLLLKTTDQSGYLDLEIINLFKDFSLTIDSIFFYRIKLNDFIKYDDVILLINPNKDKLEEAAVYLSLVHHIVHSLHVSRLLTETNVGVI